MIPILKCPICKTANNIKKWTSSESNESSNECTNCDVVFADNILSESELYTFYEKYNVNRNNDNTKLYTQRQICYKSDKRFIETNCGKKYKNILDIGCGDGQFLSLFESDKKTGFDIDKNSIEINKNIYKNILFISDLNEIKKDDMFDLIIFRGTFQYMRDIEFIQKFINEHLIHMGYLVILSLPNKNSPLAMIQREKWALYNPIEMINIFSLTSVKKLFNDYDTCIFEFPYLDTPYANEKTDLEKFIELIENKKNDKFPFWGSMIQIIFQKK